MELNATQSIDDAPALSGEEALDVLRELHVPLAGNGRSADDAERTGAVNGSPQARTDERVRKQRRQLGAPGFASHAKLHDVPPVAPLDEHVRLVAGRPARDIPANTPPVLREHILQLAEAAIDK
ncbi:MAG: hypothetical protein IRZ16_06170 [Myxococcaceae bacterium]|nr:hypothetical protein [Myxococcaceae bacterium]